MDYEMTQEDADILASRFADAEKAMAEVESGKNLPDDVSQMTDVPLFTDDGEPVLKKGKLVHLNVKRLARLASVFIEHIKSDPDTSGLSVFLDKPIIWTFEAGTAWSNGFRIAFSPFFAWQIIMKSAGEANKLEELLREDGKLDDLDRKYNLRLGKEFEFVILHEIYHTLYKHHYRGFKVYGAHPSEEEHYIANVSMDLEINRDICSQFPLYDGAVQAIKGIWYLDEKYMDQSGDKPKPFLRDKWEDIYMYFINHKDQLKGDIAENAKKSMGKGSKDPKLQKPKQKPELSEMFKKGWEHAGDMILSKLIDYNILDLEGIKTD